MSFYEPDTNTFGILGHGIVDEDTGNLINIDSGELVTAKVISLKKGEENISKAFGHGLYQPGG